MNSRYCEMVLGKDLTPIGQLNAAFLAPKTDLHLQFAYYESSLVMEFLVSKFGIQSLKQILRDLDNGIEINQAIATHTAPLNKVENDFSNFARTRAQTLTPGLDWQKLNDNDAADKGQPNPRSRRPRPLLSRDSA